MSLPEKIKNALQLIQEYINETPLIYSLALSKQLNLQAYFKLENLQKTGTFKARGAMNKLLTLTDQQRKKGVVVASSGNHGAAVAYGCYQLKSKAIIYVPNYASKVKVEAIQNYGAEVRFYGDDTVYTEAMARKFATENQMTYISPYNDIDVIAGQGTIAVELIEQLNTIDAMIVSIGGGGLISGIGAYLKAFSPKTKIIGCLPENSPVMFGSIKAGKIIEMESKPTLSDATAGGLEPGAITFELCQQYVDDYILVSEDEIKSAMQFFIEKEHMLIEGSAGVAIAALIKNKEQFKNQNVVSIICGANISLDNLCSAICE